MPTGGDSSAVFVRRRAGGVQAALPEMQLEVKRERITDAVWKRRAAGKDLSGRRRTSTDSRMKNADQLHESAEPAALVTP